MTLPTNSSHGYPRPQLERLAWISLNGAWEFALDIDASISSPADVAWSQVIQVPFAPETPASGVHRTDLFHAVWYRKAIEVPALAAQQRLLLHFGAVDYRATVWVNGRLVGHHEGGYTPFSFDITDEVDGQDPCVIVLMTAR